MLDTFLTELQAEDFYDDQRFYYRTLYDERLDYEFFDWRANLNEERVKQKLIFS